MAKKRVSKSKQEEAEIKQKPKLSKADKELYWVFGVMVAIIAVFLISFSLGQKPRNFEHDGMSFEVEYVGNIPFYKYTYTTEKLVRTTGNIIRTGEQKSVTVWLREDPRENDVPVDGKISYLPAEKFIYVTFDPDEMLCEYSPVALANLGTFMNQNGYKLKAGITDEEQAEADNELNYITCENRPDHMVLNLVAGEESSISIDGNCYTLTISDCEVLPVTEKFILQSLIDARE